VSIVLSSKRVTRELTALSHEVARKTLNLEDVRRYEIPLPDLDIQREVVEAVESAESWIAEAQHLVASAKQRSRQLCSAVLIQGFSGKLVPQDVEDEPASVLLDRVLARSAMSARSSRTRQTRKKAATA
jgi:type I restriction enzyme S subunit